MSPLELLNSVKGEFPVLYIKDPSLQTLLEKTLGTYQDKAGPIGTVSFPVDGVVIGRPADYLSVAVALDARGVWHEVLPTVGEENALTLTVTETPATVRPVTLTYFLALRKQAKSESYQLPEDAISLLFDHLYANIDIGNTRRAREVSVATGMQAELPTEDELRTRLGNIELSMEESQAIIPIALVY